MYNQKIKEMTIFAMFGAIMFISKLIMEFLPNIHPLGLFITVLTLLYRVKAIIPIYVYVILNGLYAGFATWWVPYTYIWLILWALIMIIPKNASNKVIFILSLLFNAIFGLAFGFLYMPFQALAFGLNLQGAISWFIAGLPFDVLHMCGNIAMSFLVLPLYKTLKRFVVKK
ncbi:MAG: hypothetical protein IJW54_05845 [Clostridia bacterium]|nr:hypothetical protein [Clostridia bacterium]